MHVEKLQSVYNISIHYSLHIADSKSYPRSNTFG